MKIVSEIVGVSSFICFQEIVENNYPDISAVRFEWLHDKGEVECSSSHLIIYIFDIRKQMNSQSAILSFSFKDDLLNLLFPVERNGVKKGMAVVNGTSAWQHIVAEEPSLKHLGPAGKLRRC